MNSNRIEYEKSVLHKILKYSQCIEICGYEIRPAI